MDYLQQHVESFNDATKRLFHGITAEFNAQLERRTVEKYREIADDFERLRDRASRANQLEEENIKLREQLGKLRANRDPQRLHVQPSNETSEDSAETDDIVRHDQYKSSPTANNEFAALKFRYNKLEKESRILAAENENVKAKLVKAQQKLKRWDQYGDCRSSPSAVQAAGYSGDVDAESNRLPFPELNTTFPENGPGTFPPPSDRKQRSVAHTFRAEGSKFENRNGDASATSLLDRGAQTERRRFSGAVPAIAPYQDEIRESSPELPPMPLNLSHEGELSPDTSSNRQVEGAQVDLASEVQATEAFPSSSQTTGVVEREESPAPVDYFSDTPTVVATRSLKRKRTSKPCCTERIDPSKLDRALDHVGDHVAVKCEAGSSSPAIDPVLSTMPPTFENLDLDADELPEGGLESNVSPAQRRSSQFRKTNIPIQRRLQDIQSSPTRATSEPPEIHSSQRRAGPLTSVDPNSRNLIRKNSRHSARPIRRKSSEARGVAAIPMIAEDGDNLGPTSKPKVHEDKNLSTISAHRRLGTLLAEPSPSKSVLQVTPRAIAAKSAPRKTAQHSERCLPNSVSAARTPIPGSRRVRKWNEQIVNDEGITPDHEPYRALPLHKLNLEHFKINSDHNQGLDFAYRDVVRKREERKCLSGCTRPECCGTKFRILAELGLPTKRQDHTPFGPSPGDGDVSDQLLLEAYLGEDRQKLATMTADEKKKLLLEAKTRQLAQFYGKHRNAHERPRSPPGFWRTEMPDTQEAEQDRIEAHQRLRQLVEERRREAVRGGIWKFADE